MLISCLFSYVCYNFIILSFFLYLLIIKIGRKITTILRYEKILYYSKRNKLCPFWEIRGLKVFFLTFFMFKMVKHSRRIHTFEASNWTQRYGGMTKYANKFPNLPIFWICEGNSPANSSTMPVHPCMHIRVHAKKEKMKERGERIYKRISCEMSEMDSFSRLRLRKNPLSFPKRLLRLSTIRNNLHDLCNPLFLLILSIVSAHFS